VDGAVRQGALVISLDFELMWGIRDTLAAGGGYRDNLYGAREAVPRILDLFAEYDVAATWATVGFLFAESREELEHCSPSMKPRYANPALDPYAELLGENERDDPLHFAPSLVKEIAARPRQEVGSHSFSHYYCLEPGQGLAEFEADVVSAVRLAAARGLFLRSFVFPRNQVRQDYLGALASHGFTSYRGAEANLLNRPRPGTSGSTPLRAVRLADTFLNLTGSGAVPWTDLVCGGELVDVRGSRFLRPWTANMVFESMRWNRVANSMVAAARRGDLYHLWWHPHNFGVNLAENLAALRRHLELYRKLSGECGFRSLSMSDAAEVARLRCATASDHPIGLHTVHHAGQASS